MLTKEIDHLDLKQIAGSGQCFRFKAIDDCKYSVVAFGRYLEITQSGEAFTFSCDETEFNAIWSQYFDLSTDYNYIENLINTSNDSHLKEAYAHGNGIRILRQDLWEMIVTFMISQNNNIKRIAGSVEAICERAGYRTPDGKGYRFPMPGEISPEFFMDKSLGLGYRDKYLSEIYAFASSNSQWLTVIQSLTYEDAMTALMERKGIGKKVANCISLFGLHHVEAFPIDTHVKQLLEKYYSDGFDYERYDGVAGIIQQYLFYYELG